MFSWLRNLFVRSDKSVWSKYNTPAGVTVTQETALGLPHVYAAVRCIAETIASLPLPVYRRLDTGGKERDRNHRLYRLLHDEPNGEQSALQFRENLLGHVLLWGNGYAEIQRERDGTPIALWPLSPKQVRPTRIDGQLIYDLGQGRRLLPENIIHIAGLGFDGVQGYSPITTARRTIALGLAAESFGEAFFGNHAQPGGFLVCESPVPANAKKEIVEDFEERHAGPSNAGRTGLLFGKFSWQSLGMPNEDSQWLETRMYNVTQIATLYNLPPYKIGDLSHATFSNIEHAAIDFVVHSIRPWCVRLEQEFNRKLFFESERQVFFCEHLIDGLLRGDKASRAAANQIEFMNGALDLDTWAEQENRNPLPDGLGKIRFVPANLVPITKLVDQANAPAPTPEPEPTPASPAATDAVRMVLADSVGRMLRREAAAIRKAVKKPGFHAWPDEFYGDHRSMIVQAIGPAVQALRAVSNWGMTAEELAEKIIADSRKELASIMQAHYGADLEQAVLILADRWEKDRAESYILP